MQALVYGFDMNLRGSRFYLKFYIIIYFYIFLVTFFHICVRVK